MGQPRQPNEGRSSPHTVTIGLRDLYDMLQAVQSSQSALATKLDTALIQQSAQTQNLAQQIADIRHDINDHETRIRYRESQNFVTARSVWTAIGVLTGVLAVIITILQVVLPP